MFASRCARAFVSFLLVSLVAMVPLVPAYADGVCQARVAAQAACAQQQQQTASIDPTTTACEYHPAADGNEEYLFQYQSGARGYEFPYQCPASSGPCSDMAPQHIYSDGQVLEGSSTCVRGPVQSDGSQLMCGVQLEPVKPPVRNFNNGGQWETYMSYSPTGSVCGEGNGTDPGLIFGAPGGPTVPPASAPPPLPDPLPPDNPAPPKLCGGASCYDPGSGKACAMVGGSQVCVDVPAPGPGGTPPGAGGCVSNGSGTICSGAPTAPPPPLPPGSPITDPATAFNGQTNNTFANPSTGVPYGTTTTVYAQPGTNVSNGQQPGDSGPASPSTSPSPPKKDGSFGGGGDCQTPPTCSGDPVMCGIAATQWVTTCQVHRDALQLHTDLTGATGKAPTTFEADKAKFTQADVWSDAAPVGDGGQGDAANAGNYNQAGFGYSAACPMHDIVVSVMGKSLAIPLGKGCDALGFLKNIILGFALYKAIKITAGAGEKGVS